MPREPRNLSLGTEEWRDPSRRDPAGLVVVHLATAARHGLPLVPALKGLLLDRSRASPFTRPTGAVGWDKWEAPWRRRLTDLIAHLERGEPLAEGLRPGFARRLPPHVVPAIAAAERAERLPEVLPILAHGLLLRRRSRAELGAALAYPLTVFFNALLILFGLLVFIVPKFWSIAEELGGGLAMRHTGPGLAAGVPHAFALLATISRFVAGTLPRCIVPALVLLAVAFIVRATLVRTAWGERLLWAIPWSGGLRRHAALLDLAAAMSAFLAGGQSLPAAAAAAAEGAGPLLRRRLGGFLADLEAGTPWADAWQALQLGSPFHDWIIRNAAARQDPESGFALLAETLQAENRAAVVALSRWLEPCQVLINGAVVGCIVYAVFGSLVQILYCVIHA